MSSRSGAELTAGTSSDTGDDFGGAITYPAELSETAHGLALSNAYRAVLFRGGSARGLARDRDFFELLIFFSTRLACLTFPDALHKQVATEVARLGRSNYFNSERRKQEASEDAGLSKITARQVYDMQMIGQSERDARVLNTLNSSRRTSHPVVPVVARQVISARTPTATSQLPNPEMPFSRTMATLRSHRPATSTMRAASSGRPASAPFDAFFNTPGLAVAAQGQHVTLQRLVDPWRQGQTPPPDARALQARLRATEERAARFRSEQRVSLRESRTAREALAVCRHPTLPGQGQCLAGLRLPWLDPAAVPRRSGREWVGPRELSAGVAAAARADDLSPRDQGRGSVLPEGSIGAALQTAGRVPRAGMNSEGGGGGLKEAVGAESVPFEQDVFSHRQNPLYWYGFVV